MTCENTSSEKGLVHDPLAAAENSDRAKSREAKPISKKRQLERLLNQRPRCWKGRTLAGPHLVDSFAFHLRDEQLQSVLLDFGSNGGQSLLNIGGAGGFLSSQNAHEVGGDVLHSHLRGAARVRRWKLVNEAGRVIVEKARSKPSNPNLTTKVPTGFIKLSKRWPLPTPGRAWSCCSPDDCSAARS